MKDTGQAPRIDKGLNKLTFVYNYRLAIVPLLDFASVTPNKTINSAYVVCLTFLDPRVSLSVIKYLNMHF